MNHQEQKINYDKHRDESKTRTHRLSKLPDDGDPWAPNNLLTPEQKKNISWTPVGQATNKKRDIMKAKILIEIDTLRTPILLVRHIYVADT